MRRAVAAAVVLAVVLAAVVALVGYSARERPPPVPPRHSPSAAFAVGVDLFVDKAFADGTARYAGPDFSYIRDVLHVRSVQIDWMLYSSGNRVYAGAGTASPAALGSLAREARGKYGLTVTYRVLFSIPAPPGRTGRIKPASPAAWFASLYRAEKPYLDAAEQDGVTEFIAGTEQTPIEAAPGWGAFYRRAARIYDGTLSYATWGGHAGVLYGSTAELPPVRDYGITAYPDLRLPPAASQRQVTAAWVSYLGHLPPGIRARTALDEVGIPAAAGAYGNPWDFTAYNGAADNAVQARWFTAACTAARKFRMRGVWFFPVFLGDNPYDPYPGLAKFENRPAAEAAIRACAEEGR